MEGRAREEESHACIRRNRKETEGTGRNRKESEGVGRPSCTRGGAPHLVIAGVLHERVALFLRVGRDGGEGEVRRVEEDERAHQHAAVLGERRDRDAQVEHAEDERRGGRRIVEGALSRVEVVKEHDARHGRGEEGDRQEKHEGRPLLRPCEYAHHDACELWKARLWKGRGCGKGEAVERARL